MPVKSQSGRIFDLPTPEEKSAIQAGIAQDPDTYKVTDTEYSKWIAAYPTQQRVSTGSLCSNLCPLLVHLRVKTEGYLGIWRDHVYMEFQVVTL